MRTEQEIRAKKDMLEAEIERIDEELDAPDTNEYDRKNGYTLITHLSEAIHALEWALGEREG
jgi:hypothetical protein